MSSETEKIVNDLNCDTSNFENDTPAEDITLKTSEKLNLNVFHKTTDATAIDIHDWISSTRQRDLPSAPSSIPYANMKTDEFEKAIKPVDTSGNTENKENAPKSPLEESLKQLVCSLVLSLHLFHYYLTPNSQTRPIFPYLMSHDCFHSSVTIPEA